MDDQFKECRPARREGEPGPGDPGYKLPGGRDGREERCAGERAYGPLFEVNPAFARELAIRQASGRRETRPRVSPTLRAHSPDAIRTVRELAKRGDLYIRQGALAKVTSASDGPARIEPVDCRTLPAMIVQAVRCAECRGEEIPPSQSVAKAVLQTAGKVGPYDAIPAIEGVHAFPFLRPDGSICNARGRDPVTGRVLIEALPKVPTAPRLEGALASARALRDAVASPWGVEFEKHADWPTWLAALLAPFVARDGRTPCPVFRFDAPPSVAKYLADGLATIATGHAATLRRVAGVMTSEANRHLDKCDFGGERVAVVAPRSLSYCDVALTDWRDSHRSLETVFIFIANAQHIHTHTRQISPTCRAAQGRYFNPEYALAKIRQRRGKLAYHALTILRAYVHAGSPDRASGYLERDAVRWLTGVNVGGVQ